MRRAPHARARRAQRRDAPIMRALALPALLLALLVCVLACAPHGADAAGRAHLRIPGLAQAQAWLNGNSLGEEFAAEPAAVVSLDTNTPRDGYRVTPDGSVDAALPLALCDCEEVTTNNGLNCDKEGWFVASFRHALVWQHLSGRVPLSKAVCCRPCLPKPEEIPAVTGTPVAMVSVGCHPTTGVRGSDLICDGDDALIAGWGASARYTAMTGSTYWFPEAPAQCCAPAVLLDTGDALQVSRCNCRVSGLDDINCNHISPNHLLWGYSTYRTGYLGSTFPLAPAECCEACLTGKVLSLDECADLNHCSGHGVCVMGNCDCHPGHEGADCSKSKDHSRISTDTLLWALPVTVVGGCFLASVAMATLRGVVDWWEERRAGDDSASQDGQHLTTLLRLEEEGSVGSEDSTLSEISGDEHDDDDDENLDASAGDVAHDDISLMSEEDRVEHDRGGDDDAAIAPAHSRAAARQARMRRMLSGAATSSHAAEDESEIDDEEEEEYGDAEEGDATDALMGAGRGRGGGEAMEGVPAGRGMEEQGGEGSEQGEGAKKKDGSVCVPVYGPDGVPEHIETVTCSICMLRPVQVVLVPCGHSNLCRRCSRRLEACPFCRKDIARRQRLYITA